MADQLATLQTHACALADALETVLPEYRTLGLSSAFRQSPSIGESPRASIAGMRQGLDDILTMLSQLSGAQLRAVALNLRNRHGLELDSWQAPRLRRIAAVRERGRVTSDEYEFRRARV